MQPDTGLFGATVNKSIPEETKVVNKLLFVERTGAGVLKCPSIQYDNKVSPWQAPCSAGKDPARAGVWA